MPRIYSLGDLLDDLGTIQGGKPDDERPGDIAEAPSDYRRAWARQYANPGARRLRVLAEANGCEIYSEGWPERMTSWLLRCRAALAVDHHVDPSVLNDELVEKLAESVESRRASSEREVPKKYLASWREILVALGMNHNTEDTAKVRRLNKSYSGPITIPGQGRQPFVGRFALLEWWGGLDAKVQSADQRKSDVRATMAGNYPHGRGGEAAPDIGGGVKKRRRDRKP